MTLLRKISIEISQQEAVLEALLLADFFDDKGIIVQESIGTFITASKKLIDSLHMAGDEQEHAHLEVSQHDIDRLDRFATILAGLEYFRVKNVGPDERKALEPVLDNDELTAYVKKMGTERAADIVEKIKSHFFKGKIINRETIDKMVEDIRKFYLSKKANVGPLLHVTHQDAE